MKKLKITLTDEEKKPKQKYKKYPRIDVDRLCFEDSDTIELMQIEHIKKIKSKVIKRYFIPTVIISALLIIGCVVSSVYFLSIQDSQIAKITNERDSERGRAETLAEKVRTYQKNSINNPSTNTDDLENNSSNWRDDARKILEMRENESSSTNSSSSQTETSSSHELERTCSIPDCNNTPQTGSNFCYQHECSTSGCHEQRFNDNCNYCENHRCTVPGCMRKRQNESYYCSQHECLHIGCHKKRTQGVYCSVHQY